MVGYLISAQARVGFYALSVNWLKTDVPWETGGVFPKSYNGHNRRGRTLSISCVIYHNIHYTNRYGAAAESIADWCAVNCHTAALNRSGQRVIWKQALRLFLLHRDGRVLADEWDN